MTVAARRFNMRTRVIIMVLTVAVAPLTFIGLWVTRSASAAGESLLQADLVAAASIMKSSIERRWRFLEGDLGLLARNSVVVRAALASWSQPLSPLDAAYLDGVFVPIRRQFREVSYYDRSGLLRYRLPSSVQGDSVLRPGTNTRDASAPTIAVRIPILSEAFDTVGSMAALVLLPSLLPDDSSARLPSRAVIQAIDRSSGVGVMSSMIADSLLRLTRFESRGEVWLAAHQHLDAPSLDLVVAAPRTHFVQPFQETARFASLAVIAVALLVIVSLLFLTRRVTVSLERLAGAASAVADGELDRSVPVDGDDEVGRVAMAFNRMTESLRQILGTLAQRQALATIGELTAALAHEVRNALTSARIDLQRAQERSTEPASDADGSRRQLVARALDTIERLDGTIARSLKAASRAGHAPTRLVDITSIAKSAVRATESAFVARSAPAPRLSGSAWQSEVWMHGDPLALEQLFINLLLNAAQASSVGDQATVALEQSDTHAVVTVHDEGSGIAAADLDRVLDPFFTTRADGTGLGLPIARQIATAHGGSLRVTSVVAEGTSVEVRLPFTSHRISNGGEVS